MALWPSRDTCESFGAMVFKPVKHLTRRRRLAVTAEVRPHKHPRLRSAPHPTHAPSPHHRDSDHNACQAEDRSGDGNKLTRRAASSRPACVREYIWHGVGTIRTCIVSGPGERRPQRRLFRTSARAPDENWITSPAPRCCLHMGPALSSGRAPIRGRERARTPRERSRLHTQRILF
jgi:hypothetical protein